MDRGAWRATVRGVTRVGHCLAMKPPPTIYICIASMGIPGDSPIKNMPANAGDVGLIPGSERSPGAGNGNPV